jgi:hypothetical protein
MDGQAVLHATASPATSAYEETAELAVATLAVLFGLRCSYVMQGADQRALLHLVREVFFKVGSPVDRL